MEIDNNAAQWVLRAIALGRKNYLVAGGYLHLLGSAKLNGVDPEGYLSSMLRRIADHSINRIADLLPWNLFPPNRGRRRRHDTPNTPKNTSC